MPKWPWSKNAPPTAAPAAPSTQSHKKECGFRVRVSDGEVRGVVVISTPNSLLFVGERLDGCVEEAAARVLASSTTDGASKVASSSLWELARALQTLLKNDSGEKAPPFQVVSFEVLE